MLVQHIPLSIQTRGQGLIEITDRIAHAVARARLRDGLVNVFCLHTSCSLVLMENADPSARRDLERWLNRLVPENDPLFSHTLEGPDDMPSHIKMALTRSSESIPVRNESLLLGSWQGLFLWEHRSHPHSRNLTLTLLGSSSSSPSSPFSPP